MQLSHDSVHAPPHSSHWYRMSGVGVCPPLTDITISRSAGTSVALFSPTVQPPFCIKLWPCATASSDACVALPGSAGAPANAMTGVRLHPMTQFSQQPGLSHEPHSSHWYRTSGIGTWPPRTDITISRSTGVSSFSPTAQPPFRHTAAAPCHTVRLGFDRPKRRAPGLSPRSGTGRTPPIWTASLGSVVIFCQRTTTTVIDDDPSRRIRRSRH